ncbi:hypothetical protein A2U01_0099465, partial [Trifolium medium]|nr:hypothetical protein [Trifolium medium]
MWNGGADRGVKRKPLLENERALCAR